MGLRGEQVAVETVLKGRSCIYLLLRSWRLFFNGCEKFVYGGRKELRGWWSQSESVFQAEVCGISFDGLQE